MPAAVSLFVFASLAAPPLEPGTWIPTEGPAAERPIQGIALGGDGAIYAASQGRMFRLAPGEAWKANGGYTPTVGYDPDEGIQVEGDFDAAFLEAARVELNQALIPHIGVDDDVLISGNEDVIDQAHAVFEAYTAEPDPVEDSIYAVHRVAWAKDGVWIATGGGLFKSTQAGTIGPITGEAPVLDVMESKTEVLIIGPSGVRQVVDRKAVPWRQFIAKTLSRVDGRVAFIAEGTSWWDDGQVGPRRIAPPTGTPRQIASGGTLLFVATDLAVYRREGESWTLCPRLPETPQRLISTDQVLLAVGEQQIYAADLNCTQWIRHPVPWLTEMRFTDAAISDAGVWGATSDGVFLLAPRDHDLMTATAVEGFQRELARLPSWPEAYAAAQEALAVDAATNSYGSRPLFRLLLPSVEVLFATWPGRVEEDPTFLGGTPRVTTLPRDYFAVWAVWDIDFRSVAQLFVGAGADTNVGDDQDELDVELAGRDDVVEADDQSDFTAEEALAGEASSGLAGFTVLDDDLDLPAEPVDEGFSSQDFIANERARLRRERQSLYVSLRRLYRERLRLMHRLYLTQKDVDPVDLLRLQELDARIDAYTGGAWMRALGRTR